MTLSAEEIREALRDGVRTFTYEASYGYVGGSRPLKIRIADFDAESLLEIEDECEFMDEIGKMLWEEFQNGVCELDITGTGS
jgi:hypothetical protein